jgi:hypothetical protein
LQIKPCRDGDAGSTSTAISRYFLPELLPLNAHLWTKDRCSSDERLGGTRTGSHWTTKIHNLFHRDNLRAFLSFRTSQIHLISLNETASAAGSADQTLHCNPLGAATSAYATLVTASRNGTGMGAASSKLIAQHHCI